MMRSVRMRLTLWNVGVLALILVVLGAVFLYRVRVVALAVVDRGMARYAQRYLTEPGSREDHRPPGDLGPRLLGAAGKPLSPSDPDLGPWDRPGFAQALAGRKSYALIRVGGEPARVFSLPLERQGRVVGVAQFARSLTQMRQDEEQVAGTLLFLIPWGLLIAGAGGAFLTDRALRPVRHIAHAASRIEAENLSGRLPTAGGDEFAHLAETFNAMLGRLERAFRDLGQAYERLEGAYEQQRRFAADASHELRTPLAIVKANASLALSGQRTAEQYREKLQAVDGAADRMGRIVQDLLLLARSDAGQLSYELVPTPLAPTLEQAAEAVQGIGTAPVRLDLPPAPLCVPGHADSLTRLFVNLLENALRHTPASGCVTLSAASEGGQAVVRVADTGEGIPPEHLPHVGERFYRVDAARARKDGGTGLGLSICRSIVEMHGGEMTIESTVGRGTTVTVRLPSEKE